MMIKWISDRTFHLLNILQSSQPRDGLHPIPGTKALTLEAALLPPLLYYVALLFLPSSPPPAVDGVPLKILRNVLAISAATLFFRLPLAYHVPQSIGLTYQLGLVGLYGGLRVVDAFLISPYLFNHIPRRVRYTHVSRVDDSTTTETVWTDGGMKDHFSGKSNPDGALKSPKHPEEQKHRSEEPTKESQPSLTLIDLALKASRPIPVYETAHTEQAQPTTFLERASWALELELSMRGIGFTWTTADVRHTRKTWLPTVANRIHSIFVHVLPVLLGSWVVIRSVYEKYLSDEQDLFIPQQGVEVFDINIPFGIQLILTLALGAFLMAAFSLGHSMFAIICAPLAPSPLAFFPPLYSIRVWKLTTVRRFWSYGWHRLFARLFLVYGSWPGEWLERKLTGKSHEQPADVGKVLGAFLASAFVHSFSVRGVLGGHWRAASGEAQFFILNGFAIVFEEIVIQTVKKIRQSRGYKASVWYDAWIGRVWWIAVLLITGRNFARGWVKSGLIREMAFV